ncbi:MAG TPA: L-threonylcarbamoyladenylate synthase [Gemmatimonadaceae bacterium]|nr:L-threonylcarbamoyladenylate synthase [Gemmatimonadaceae bacterium]
MRMLRVDPEHPEAAAIAEAAAVIRAGGLVAFPTETVYGLGAHALDERAVQRIYEAKGRPSYNPLIVHVADAAQAAELVTSWPPAADALARRFWPGPLTLVLPKRAVVPDAITAGLPAMALRVPAHPVALALLREAACPIAAPSANRFTELSPTTAQHVAKSLGDRVDVILDGGATSVGIESTVVDLGGPRPRVLRPGVISRAELEAVIGPLADDAQPTEGDAPRPAPGMVDRHYAPRARVLLFDAGSRDEALREATRVISGGQPVGALAFGSLPLEHVRIMPRDPRGYARRLYAELHALDDAGCALVLVERAPESAEWAGVRDRLERASR